MPTVDTTSITSLPGSLRLCHRNFGRVGLYRRSQCGFLPDPRIPYSSYRLSTKVYYPATSFPARDYRQRRGTLLNGCIYLTGGNQQHRQNTLYKLDLNTGRNWQKLSAYPGPQRVQPILVHDAHKLYLIGGYQAASNTSESILSHDIVCYLPETDRWEYESDIPLEENGEKRCMAGGSGTQTSTHLILTGGVNYGIFKKALDGKAGKDYLTHDPSWYQFNDDLLCFDFTHNKWTQHPNIPGMARAGGILLLHHHCLYMVCGEIKPGIRTPKITIYPLKKEKLLSK